jgi:hypothetical protein
MSYTQGPQILQATGKNLLARLTWQPGFVHPCTQELRKGYVDALHYLYSSANNTRMTTSENVGCLRYVEITDVFKICVTKLKAVVSNFWARRTNQEEKCLKATV